MKQLCDKKIKAETKSNNAIIPIDPKIVKAEIIKTEEINVDESIKNIEAHTTEQRYIPFLIFLLIGMIFQLTGNATCVLAGTLICVSVCSLTCISVCVSAVFSKYKSNSSPGTS